MKSSKVQNRKFCYVVSSFLKHKNWDAFGAHYYFLGFSNNRVVLEFISSFSSLYMAWNHYAFPQVSLQNHPTINKLSQQDLTKQNCLFTLVAVSDICDFLGHGPVHAILKSSRKLTNSA